METAPRPIAIVASPGRAVPVECQLTPATMDTTPVTAPMAPIAREPSATGLRFAADTPIDATPSMIAKGSSRWADLGSGGPKFGSYQFQLVSSCALAAVDRASRSAHVIRPSDMRFSSAD